MEVSNEESNKEDIPKSKSNSEIAKEEKPVKLFYIIFEEN